jgi:hypothetical protein
LERTGESAAGPEPLPGRAGSVCWNRVVMSQSIVRVETSTGAYPADRVCPGAV